MRNNENNFEFDGVNLDDDLPENSENKRDYLYEENNNQTNVNKTDIHQGKSLRDKFFKPFEFNLKKIIAGVVVIIVVVLIGWLLFFSLFFGGNKKADNTVKNNTEQSIDKTTDTQNDNPADSKLLFKKSIKQAVDAQAGKHEISVAWRKITVNFIQDGDKDKYKDAMKKINEERIKYLEQVPNDSNDLNKLVIASLNNQKDYMIKGYKADNPEDASEIYNKFNQSDKEEDSKYIEKLTSLLSENKIEYKVNKTDQGTEINY